MHKNVPLCVNEQSKKVQLCGDEGKQRGDERWNSLLHRYGDVFNEYFKLTSYVN
jgi:hypothetical protein